MKWDMRVHRLRAHFIIWPILAAVVCFVRVAGAQPQSRLTFCLQLAQSLQVAVYAEKKQYITKEDDLRKQLTSGCASLRYEFSPKANGGFRVTAEQDGEAWSIDERRELIQLSSKSDGTKKADSTASPGTAAAAKPGEKSLSVDAEAGKRLEKCFAKSRFHTEECKKLFDELDKKCGGDNVPLMKICLQLEQALSTVEMSECIGDEDNWGKCAMRSRQLEKNCSNPLRQSSAECRGLVKYMAWMTPPTVAPAAAAPAAPAAKTPVQKPSEPLPPKARAPSGSAVNPEATPVPYERIDPTAAKTIDSGLRTLLRLRPVSYESKITRGTELGFIAEEVEMVSPRLVNYDSRGQLQGVKYNQFSALFTSGLQELYGTCRSDQDLQKDLVRRLIKMETENAALRKENVEFRKMLFNFSNDLQSLKDRLGGK